MKRLSDSRMYPELEAFMNGAEESRPMEKHEVYRKVIGGFLAEGAVPTLTKVDLAYDCLRELEKKHKGLTDEDFRGTVKLMLYGKVCP